MRINVYEEELTDEVTIVTKEVPQGDGEITTFYGVRFWLESPQTILDHSTPDDDDRNAITLWVRASYLAELRRMLQYATNLVEDERTPTWAKT